MLDVSAHKVTEPWCVSEQNVPGSFACASEGVICQVWEVQQCSLISRRSEESHDQWKLTKVRKLFEVILCQGSVPLQLIREEKQPQALVAVLICTVISRSPVKIVLARVEKNKHFGVGVYMYACAWACSVSLCPPCLSTAVPLGCPLCAYVNPQKCMCVCLCIHSCVGVKVCRYKCVPAHAHAQKYMSWIMKHEPQFSHSKTMSDSRILVLWVSMGARNDTSCTATMKQPIRIFTCIAVADWIGMMFQT